MTNGLASADAWKFIFYHNIKDDPHPKWTAELPKEEEVAELLASCRTPSTTGMTKLRLTFDGAAGDERRRST